MPDQPKQEQRPKPVYVPPALRELGTLYELTLGCVKNHGHGDAFTFQNAEIVCTSP